MRKKEILQFIKPVVPNWHDNLKDQNLNLPFVHEDYHNHISFELSMLNLNNCLIGEFYNHKAVNGIDGLLFTCKGCREVDSYIYNTMPL